MIGTGPPGPDFPPPPTLPSVDGIGAPVDLVPVDSIETTEPFEPVLPSDGGAGGETVLSNDGGAGVETDGDGGERIAVDVDGVVDPVASAVTDEEFDAVLDAVTGTVRTEHPVEQPDQLVRPFVLTGGRTRTDVPEVAIETIVCARSEAGTHRSELRREERRILDILRGPMSVAEVSAHLTIPLRAAVILVSELVADGIIVAGRNADTGDTDFLMEIRSALQLL